MQWVFFSLILGLLSCITSQAADSHFCTRTNTLVKIGDTLDQVIQACGSPHAVQSQKTVKKDKHKVTQWIYDYKPNLMTVDEKKNYRAMLIVNLLPNKDAPGMKVISILLNGQPVQQTSFCGKYFPPIQVGYTNQQVWQTCNSPTHTQEIEQVISTMPVKETTMTYQTSRYTPALKMIFEDNKLKEITSE